jgi:hypothetical protein
MACFAVRLLLRPKSLRTVEIGEGQDPEWDQIAMAYLLRFVDLGEAGGISFIEVLKDDTDYILALAEDTPQWKQLASEKWPTGVVYKLVVGKCGPVVAVDIGCVTEDDARKELFQAGLDN